MATSMTLPSPEDVAALLAKMICQDTPEVVEPTKVIKWKNRADFRADRGTYLFLGEIVDVGLIVRRSGKQRTVGQIVNYLRRIDHVVQSFVFTQLAVAVELACLQAKVHDFAALSDSVVTSSNLAKEMTHDLEVNFNNIALFSGENTANELQDHAPKTQDTLFAEVAEIEPAVFQALTLCVQGPRSLTRSVDWRLQQSRHAANINVPPQNTSVPGTTDLAEMHNVFIAGQRPNIDKPDHAGDSKRDMDEHIFQIFDGWSAYRDAQLASLLILELVIITELMQHMEALPLSTPSIAKAVH